MNLLLRYYQPDAGEITVDGLPLGESGDPYARATVVRQEAVLFRGTLRDNLSMYRDIPEERLLEALAGVGLGRFAGREALDRMVEEGGANLSGGEKKRVCLARALLRDTELLILDEPLANLDGETAERIEDLLLSIRDRTLLVVSHQFSAGKLPGFDQVVDMAAGG
ncbi:MAG: ABC transporter ATP-binding protein [Oscillospiraceae bacterium]|nr:ABC transporter ATP-binding protein [Oscillospiraceae bacterium]